MHDKPMFGAVPVARIVHPESPGGFLEINQSDFDPKVHKLFKEKTKESKPKGQGVEQMRDTLKTAGVDVAPDATKAELEAMLANLDSAEPPEDAA